MSKLQDLLKSLEEQRLAKTIKANQGRNATPPAQQTNYPLKGQAYYKTQYRNKTRKV